MLKKQVFAAYIPVLHRGYIQYFDSFLKITDIYVLDEDILTKLDYIKKDLRALSPVQQTKVLSGLGRFEVIKRLNARTLKKLDKSDIEFIMPDEDICRLVGDNLKHASVNYYPVFLRWDRRAVKGVDDTPADDEITSAAYARTMMGKAISAAGQSSDIWRRLGGIIVTKNGKIIGPVANQGEPTPHSPLMEGDPRNIFNRGFAIEMSVFTHAEAKLIAEAARTGRKLDGANIYVSTFPCPACAKLIAHSGIKTCYYLDGYGVLDGKRVLEDYKVKTVRVNFPDNRDTKDPAAIPYIN